jgi:hypothetical protein
MEATTAELVFILFSRNHLSLRNNRRLESSILAKQVLIHLSIHILRFFSQGTKCKFAPYFYYHNFFCVPEKNTNSWCSSHCFTWCLRLLLLLHLDISEIFSHLKFTRNFVWSGWECVRRKVFDNQMIIFRAMYANSIRLTPSSSNLLGINKKANCCCYFTSDTLATFITYSQTFTFNSYLNFEFSDRSVKSITFPL